MIIDQISRQTQKTTTSSRILDYEFELIAQGRRVPARGARPDRPHNARIAKETGIHATLLCAPSIKSMLAAMGQRLGYETVFEQPSHHGLLVRELTMIAYDPIELATAHLTAGERDDAFREALAATHAQEGPTGWALSAVIAAIDLASQENRRGGPAFRILETWRRHIEAYAPDGKPTDARERLRLELSRRGMTAADLARLVGGEGQKSGFSKRLGLVIIGNRRFSARDSAIKDRIERALDLAPGCLSLPGQDVKRGNGNFRRDEYPPEKLDLTAAQRSAISKYLPSEFVGMSDQEKVEAVDTAMEMIAAQITPENAARAKLQAEAYAIRGPLPARLGREIASLRAFYCGAIVPDGRANDRRVWADQTMLLRENQIRLLAGWACLRSRGDLALDLASLSVVTLMHPQVVKGFLAFRHRRAALAFGRKRLTSEDVGFWLLARTLLDPDNGWMTQAEQLKDRLEPARAWKDEVVEDPDSSGCDAQGSSDATTALSLLDEDDPQAHDGVDARRASVSLVTAGEVVAARTEWAAYCRMTRAALIEEIRSHSRRTLESRNAHAAIAAILRMQRPAVAFAMMIQGLRSELRNLQWGSIAYAEVQRDLVAIMLNCQLCFRTKTFCGLNLANLVPKADGFRVEVSRHRFKNAHGPFFIAGRDARGFAYYRDFGLDLVDDDGLFAQLRDHLAVGRKVLLRGRVGSQALVVGSRSVDGRITAGALDQMIRRIMCRHLVHNALLGTGVPGQTQAAGWHAFRHIGATDELKVSGSYELAADRIQDSPELVKARYGCYYSRDRDAMLAKSLAKGRATLGPHLAEARAAAG